MKQQMINIPAFSGPSVVSLVACCWLCGVVALTACSGDEADSPAAGNVPLALTAGLAGSDNASTRSATANNAWTVGDFAAVQEGSTIKKYKVTDATSGKLEGTDHANTFFWNPNTKVSRTVYAWCYGDGTYNTTHKKLTIANPQVAGTAQAVDLLWAPAVTFPYANRSTSNNALVFYHQLAKVTVNVKRETNTSGYQLNGVTLGNANIKPEGTFSNPSLTTSKYGTWAVTGTAATVTPYKTTTASGYDASYTAVVVPQTISGGLTINISLATLGTMTYNTGVTAPAAGTHYTYSIKVDKQTLSVVKSSITAWGTDGSTGTIWHY